MPAKTPPFSPVRKTFVPKSKKTSINAEKMGFSLVEILIALTLFGFLVSGMITFVTGGLEVTQKTGKRLTEQQNGNPLEKRLQYALANPVARIDSGTATTASGIILDIDGHGMFIGTKSMTGACAGGPDQEYLILHESDGWNTGENRTAGPYSIASDGLSVLSGATRILGSGIRGGNTSTNPLETEFGGISSLDFSGTTLAIADPNNEQVIFWDTSSGSLNSLTTRSLGISEPSSIRFSGNGLLIGAANGLFRVENGSSDAGKLSKSSVPGPRSGIAGLAGVRITLDGATALTGPTAAESVSIEKYSGGAWQSFYESGDTVSLAGGSLTYSFTGATKPLGAGESIRIEIQGITPAPTTAWQYVALAEFLDSFGAVAWSTEIPYAVVWDGKIQSLGSNAISQISNHARIRKIVDENTYSQGLLDIDDYLAATGSRYVSQLPIRNFSLHENADSIVATYEAYSEYDCREGNHKSQKRVLIFRKK